MPYSLARLRVLVIDDSRFQRVLLRQMLRSFDITDVVESGTAEEAMKRCGHALPDIILLDQCLDEGMMNGLEFTRCLRAEAGQAAYLPVIMVTAHADTDLVLAARDAGVTEMLVKPISARNLLHRLITVIERPRPFVRTRSYFGPDRRRQLIEGYAGPLRRQGDGPRRVPPVESMPDWAPSPPRETARTPSDKLAAVAADAQKLLELLESWK